MPSKVLVGIPTLNGPERLERALASIKEHTDLTSVALLVSDDYSSPDNLLKNKHVAHKYNVPLLTAPQRIGVSQQWNRLVRHVPDADLVVLLNDDIEVVADWLDVLVFSLERNPNLGMVSLRCETGVIKGNCPPRPMIDHNEARLITGGGSLISAGGACFAFRRRDWESVGGFDERYFCFYEEVDFGVMLAKRGLFSAFASYPVVYHMGGATTSNLSAAQYLEESRTKFWDKWKVTLDDLRAEFAARPRLVAVEWNSQWKNWRHP